jgi:HPt (histidine-containing phosphotransfer) domain-containing protein
MLKFLIDTFLGTASAQLTRFAEIARVPAHRAEALRIAHSLKSSGAMVGAGALSALAASAEAALTNGAVTEAIDPGEMERRFEAFRAALTAKGLAA